MLTFVITQLLDLLTARSTLLRMIDREKQKPYKERLKELGYVWPRGLRGGKIMLFKYLKIWHMVEG